MRRKRATAATTRFGRRKRSGREFKKRARAAGLQLKPPPPFPGEPVFPKVGSPLKKKAAPVPIRECRSWDLDQITRARIRAFTPPVLGLGAKLQGTECGRAGWDHTRTGLYECTRVVRREIKAEAISGAGGGGILSAALRSMQAQLRRRRRRSRQPFVFGNGSRGSCHSLSPLNIPGVGAQLLRLERFIVNSQREKGGRVAIFEGSRQHVRV